MNKRITTTSLLLGALLLCACKKESSAPNGDEGTSEVVDFDWTGFGQV